MLFQILHLLLLDPVPRGVKHSSLSNSSSSSESLYNSIYCCHLSAISSSSIRVFPSFYSIIICFIFGVSKKLSDKVVWLFIISSIKLVFNFSKVLSKPFYFIFLSLSIYKISKSVIFTFVFIMFVFSSLFY